MEEGFLLFLSEGRCLQEGPKYRGKQSIKLRRRFEREGDGLNAQLGRTFFFFRKIERDDPTWVVTPRGYMPVIFKLDYYFR